MPLVRRNLHGEDASGKGGAMNNKVYFRTGTMGEARIQAGELLTHQTKQRAQEYAESMQKLGLHSWVFSVDEQGAIIPNTPTS